LNGVEYGFQKTLDKVTSYRDVPGWSSGEKMDFMQAQIREVAKRLPPNHKHFEILDLGSWKGRSAGALANALGNETPSFVWCVDHWLGAPAERETNHIQAGIRPLSVLWEFLQYMSHLGLLGKKIGYISAPSEQAAQYFDNGQFHFMFIDGDHEQVYQDLTIWTPKLKVGGVLIGDDLNWQLVRRDWNRWREEHPKRYAYSEHNVNGPVYRMQKLPNG
jgi:predicted O-methyltransferase YrrM